nr:hypothetical protein MACL_00002300 [Theileria orientalis]
MRSISTLSQSRDNNSTTRDVRNERNRSHVISHCSRISKNWNKTRSAGGKEEQSTD